MLSSIVRGNLEGNPDPVSVLMTTPPHTYDKATYRHLAGAKVIALSKQSMTFKLQGRSCILGLHRT